MAGLTLSWLILMLRQFPCRAQVQPFSAMCYTDITALYGARGLSEGKIPYLDTPLEYPVLTGGLVELARRISGLLGAKSGPNLPGDVTAHASEVFFGVNAVLLFVLFGVLIWAHLRMARPEDAILIAIAPAIWTAGLINWDALVVALASLALLAWGRKRPALAGVFIGLGTAAKLYPAFFFVPLVILCVRAGRWRELLRALGAAVGVWLVVNVPVYLANPENWSYFWQYNSGGRGGDLGSVWYVLSLAGFDIPNAASLWLVPLAVGFAAICVLLALAPTRPRLAQGVFLVVAWFLIVNKVYSPQYVLWLLPLLILARPRWVDWIVFAVGETFYYACIWLYLDGALASGTGDQARIYWLSVVVRVGVQLWLCARVAMDVWWPETDIVRDAELDDPNGGPLASVPDAPWLDVLRRGAGAR